jgi:hypothetical protein
MAVNSSQEAGGDEGVWLRVRILNSAVFNLKTTVRAIRLSLRDAVEVRENLTEEARRTKYSDSKGNTGSLKSQENSCGHRIGLLHVGLTTEVLRQKLVADGEAMGEAETGTERAFHVAHESVGGMFSGEMEPV